MSADVELPPVPPERGSLDADQVWYLLQPLDGRRTGRDAGGHTHVMAWDIRRHLLRAFGFGGFDVEVVDLVLVLDRETPPPSGNGRSRWTVVYRATLRLTIRDRSGRVVTVLEDGATGDAQNQPTAGDAHDMALKTAMSQALKRCAANLGDQFGLGLYNGGKLDPVVVRSLGHPGIEMNQRPSLVGAEDQPSALVENDVDVSAGDDDRHAAREAAQQAAAGEESQLPGSGPQGASSGPDERTVLAQRLADQAGTATTLEELRELWRRVVRGELQTVTVVCDDGTGPPTEGELQGWVGWRRKVIEEASRPAADA